MATRNRRETAPGSSCAMERGQCLAWHVLSCGARCGPRLRFDEGRLLRAGVDDCRSACAYQIQIQVHIQIAGSWLRAAAAGEGKRER
jgi:hypothetical protein